MRKALWFAPVLSLAALLSISLSHAKDNVTAEIGMAAPAFSLENYDGKKISLADYKDKIVVLEWTNPECPIVQRHYKAKTMKTLAEKYGAKGVVWLAINSTNHADNAANKQFATTQSLSYPILNDAKGEIGHAYGAVTTPHMFIVGKDGKLVYMGGIDDDSAKGGNPKVTNFVQQALEEILNGKAVSQPKTKSYGCSVKYST